MNESPTSFFRTDTREVRTPLNGIIDDVITKPFGMEKLRQVFGKYVHAGK